MKSTRQIALENKEKKYIGAKCPLGHDGVRYTLSGNCLECVKDAYKNGYIKKGKKGKPFDPARREAKEKGEIYYFSGKPCKRGHLSKRRVATGCCQECHNLLNKKSQPDYALRSKYKINLKQYNEMLVAQKGVCAICQKPEINNKALSVDHCHDTEKVRALLCGNCNRGIGLLKHNPDLLRKAALYCE